MKKQLAIVLIVLNFILISNVLAQEFPAKTPRIEIGGKFSEDRTLGSTKLMVPLIAGNESLLFADWRARLDDNSTTEMNIGLGYRFLIYEEVIVGFYGFYDRLRSAYNHYFNQATLGAELLTEDWDFRINGYLPEDAEALVDELSTLDINGTSLSVRAGYEKPLPGLDAEIGYRLPVDPVDLRFYLGGYYFDDQGYETIAGPRARLEMTKNDLPLSFLSRDTEVALGIEFQRDSVRDEQIFGTVKIRIPFGKGEEAARSIKSIKSRINNFIERDIDIVTGEAKGPAESAVVEGRAASTALTINPGDDIDTLITNSNTNELVIVNGSQSPTGELVMKSGQVLVGGGSIVTVRGGTSGTTFSHILFGTRPTIASTVAGDDILVTNDSTTIKGIDIVDAGTGMDAIQIFDVSDVTIKDVAIRDSDYGIEMLSSGAINNIVIEGATIESVIQAISLNGMFGAIADVSISNVTINTTSDAGINIMSDVSNVTLSNITASNTTGSGFINNDGDNVTLANVIIHNPGINGFELIGDIDNFNGTGLSVTGIIPGDIVNDTAVTGFTGQISFTDGTTYP